MMLLVTFLGAICAAAAFPQSFTSRSCFERLEMECMENFVDSVFFSERRVDECSELREFVDCSSNAADHCFTLQRSREIDRGLTMFDNIYEDFCSAVYSGDDSDFDEETYSHIKLTATVRRRMKKVSPSTTDKGASEKDESFDPRNCFNERKRSCWETFEDNIIDSIFYIDIDTDGDIDTDECRALESFVQCIKEVDVDCFEDRHNRDVVDILEVWENKKKMFCGPSTPNYLPTENKVETVTPLVTPKFSSDESSNSKTCFEPRKEFCWDAFAAKFSADAPFSINKLTGIYECTDLQSFIHCIRKAADDCFEDDYDKEAVEILEKLKKNYKMFCAFIAATTDDPSGFENSIFYPTLPVNSEFSLRFPKEFINFGKEESISKLVDSAKTRDPDDMIPNPYYLSIM